MSTLPYVPEFLAYLHDCLEVESGAIPEGKLATVGTCEEPATFWRPPNNVDGMTCFVQGGMEVLCRDGICGIVWFR